MNDEQKDVLMRMGFALILVQQVESLLEFGLTFVIQKNSPLTIKSLLDQKNSERNATLGQFLCALRKRADLDDTFDHLLSEFLKNRNSLVHRVDNIDGWNLDSIEGLNIAACFVNSLIAQAIQIRNVLLALIESWVKEVGLQTPFPQELDGIRSKYSPLVEHIFF